MKLVLPKNWRAVAGLTEADDDKPRVSYGDFTKQRAKAAEKAAKQHTELFQMRLRAGDKEKIQRAASKAGLSLSSWSRERLLQAAGRELGERSGSFDWDKHE